MNLVLRTKVTRAFFDRAAVVNAVDAGRRKALSRAGAFVRRTSRSSIRKRKGETQPGRPPADRTGLLKQNIFFSYDNANDSVIVGPARLGGEGTAPRTLEQGGPATIVRWSRVKKRMSSKRVRIAARPYMLPALEKEAPKFPELFRNSVQGVQ